MSHSLTSTVLNKLRRAYRNDAGTHLTAEELRHLAQLGALHLLAKAEADEIVTDLAISNAREEDKSPEVLPRAFSVKSLAERWQCSQGLVRKLIANGELNHFRHGNLIRISQHAVLERERLNHAR